MKNLNRNQWIAVFVGMAFIAYLLFTGPIMSLFGISSSNNSSDAQAQEQQMTSGFKAEDVVVGSGPIAEPGDTLSVHYVGTLTDGQVFDSSVARGTPITFTLGVGQVIKGWDEGLVGMRVGGKRVLTISPDFGYGDKAAGPIPPNSTLVFSVELLNDQKPASR